LTESRTTNKVDLKDSHSAVIGLGHVGLPTALGPAELGWSVIGADDDASKVALIRAGNVPFYEAGVLELLVEHLATGKFCAVDDLHSAVRSASVVLICVRPSRQEDGQGDLAQVEAVARLAAHNLIGYKHIVEKSTVPVITAQWLKKTISRYLNLGRPSGLMEMPVMVDGRNLYDPDDVRKSGFE
jgi:UDPglucose 6-dehydrogenase